MVLNKFTLILSIRVFENRVTHVLYIKSEWRENISSRHIIILLSKNKRNYYGTFNTTNVDVLRDTYAYINPFMPSVLKKGHNAASHLGLRCLLK